MKPTKFLLILLVALSVTSCKKDDDGNVEFVLNNENLAGLYDLVFFEAVTTETTDVNGLDVVSVITETGDTFQVEFTFDANGTYRADGVYRIVFTTVVNGELTEDSAFIVTIDAETGTYSTTSSSSIMVLDGQTYEVTLFNENELRISLEEIETFPNGDTEMYTEELRFVRK